LHKQLVKELEIHIDNTSFWTDSTIVIQYIRNEARRFQAFVADRFALNHDVSSSTQWKHVPSELNPADHASRGIKNTDTSHLDILLVKWSFIPLEKFRGNTSWKSNYGSSSGSKINSVTTLVFVGKD